MYLYNFRHVYAPVNLGNSHWVLCHLHVGKKHISYYDPYGPDRDSYQTVSTAFVECISQIEPQSVWTVSDASVQVQDFDDVVNCGVYVCMIAELLSLGGRRDMPGLRDNAPQYRPKILGRLQIQAEREAG